MRRRYVVGLAVTAVVAIAIPIATRSARTVEVVASDTVRDELVVAIEHLLGERFVSIKSVGFTEGRRSDFEASVDTVGRRLWSRELISDGVEVGGDPSATPLVSELVVLGDEAWLRVLQPTQDPDTPFQFIDATGTASQYIDSAYTHIGRLFDSLSVLAALLVAEPFVAERLGSDTLDGDVVTGVRVTFDSANVASFLAKAAQPFISDGIDGITVFELWYDAAVLRQLVATGVHFQDGEALETAAEVNYLLVPALSIEAPTHTTPP